MLRQVWLAGADDLYCLSQARHAFRIAIDALTAMQGRAPVVWFPAYFGSETLLAVRPTGARLVFYPVTAAMTPDWPACRALAATAKPDLFVLTHYFGTVSDLPGARAFCDEVGAVLFEDASHILRPVGAVGQHGDMVCYSPRKFFHIPDGGLLAVRGAELSARVAETARSLPQARASAGRWRWREFRRGFKRRLFGARPHKPLPAVTLESEIDLREPEVAIWMSDYARRKLAALAATGGIDAVASSRMALHRELVDRLPARTGMRAVESHEGVVPVATAMRCASEDAMLRTINALRAARGRAYLWPVLPPEVKANPDFYRETLRLRRTVMYCAHQRAPDGTFTAFLDALPAMAGAAD